MSELGELVLNFGAACWPFPKYPVTSFPQLCPALPSLPQCFGILPTCPNSTCLVFSFLESIKVSKDRMGGPGKWRVKFWASEGRIPPAAVKCPTQGGCTCWEELYDCAKFKGRP